MKTLQASLCRFAFDEHGASAIEYGLFAALIAAVIMAVVGTIGTEVNRHFTAFYNALVAATG